MVADLSASAYLVDGTDVAVAGVTLLHDGAGLWSGLAEEIGAEVSPGVDGGDIGGGVFRPFTHSTMYTVHADGFDAVWAAIVALRRRCKPGRTVTLTRQMPDPEGTAANTNHTTTARRVTDRIAWLTPNIAHVDIDWLVVDSPWHGPAVAIASAAGAQSIKGDLRTHRMTITLAALAGNTARTITNTTNGFWFTYNANVPAGGVLVDVEAQTATAITGGADVSANLIWGKQHLMQFEPGSNTLTVSLSTASISYQPAYQ